jgi:exopolysaccharide biosynthesis polyprenyl glycosylphosphotransferase
VFISISRLRGQRVGVPRAVIVGTGAEAQAIGDVLRRRGRLDYEVVGWVDVPFERGRDAALPTLGVVDDLPELADRLVVDTVLFGTTLEESARLERTIWQLQEVGKTVHLRGDALGGLLSRTLVGDLDGIPMFTLTSVPMDRVALGVKRAIDLAGSSVGLVLLSPFLLGVAGLVKLTSAGPVLHRQERLGLNARRFEMLKFRSMYDGAEAHRADLAAANEMSGPVFKMRNDPRVTPLGRWLRRYSIDELPQLWNVLRGQMSLVGPRPPLGPEVALYERWQRRRLSMKPGLTCLWQVNGRSELDFDTWMKLDLEYIDNWSLGLDLKILLKTIPVVLTARGAR